MDGIVVFAVDAALWLAGRWHYTLRHGHYKSPLAGFFFCRCGTRLVRSDPQRRMILDLLDPPVMELARISTESAGDCFGCCRLGLRFGDHSVELAADSSGSGGKGAAGPVLNVIGQTELGHVRVHQ